MRANTWEEWEDNCSPVYLIYDQRSQGVRFALIAYDELSIVLGSDDF